MTLQCADYDSTEAAIKHYLDSVGATSPDVICLAAAGPVVGQRVRMTNNHWTLASDELASEFSANAVRLLNDFEAIAYSVPLLASSDCEAIGLPDPGPLPDEQYTVAIVGPGTGLGAVGCAGKVVCWCRLLARQVMAVLHRKQEFSWTFFLLCASGLIACQRSALSRGPALKISMGRSPVFTV